MGFARAVCVSTAGHQSEGYVSSNGTIEWYNNEKSYNFIIPLLMETDRVVVSSARSFFSHFPIITADGASNCL